jgi:TRAP-type mannitol/chloroaromatic compound transport system permease small subunit
MAMSENEKKCVIDKFSEWGAIFAGLALMFMMFIGALDVIFSKFFNKPIPGTFEATEALMIVSAFMAISYNQVKRGHISVQLITSHLRGSTKIVFDSISYLFSFAFFALIAWQGWQYGLHSLKVLEYESGLINFPVYPSKLLLALGASMVTVQCLADFIRELRKLRKV